MLGFAVLALLAYPSFFVFLVSTSLGWFTTTLTGMISLGVAGYQVSKPAVRRDLRLADVWLPLLLLFLYTFSCIFVLLLHGGSAAAAFKPHLAPDNILPKMVAEHLWRGGERVPHGGIDLLRMDNLGSEFGDWRSSDRPPLQSCIYLLCLPFRELYDANIYNFVATFCQTIWLPAVFLLARQLHFSRYALGLILVWFAGSGFFLVHSIYTWPKLLAASLFLTGLSVLFFCDKKLPARHPKAVIVIGLVWSLALLSHGGVIFSLLAVPLLPSAWRLMRTGAPTLLTALAVFVLVGLPWNMYQQFYDPPGNRLIKWHMAGVVPINSRGALETVVDAYANLTFGQWLENRWGNVETSLAWDDIDKYGPIQSVDQLQSYLCWESYQRTSAAIGLLIAGYIALLVAWRRGRLGGLPADSRWRELPAMCVGTYLIWITLMFQPDGAVVSQGSYAMIIVLMMIGALGLASLPKWAGLSLLVAQWGLYCFIFLFFTLVSLTRNLDWWTAQGGYWVFILLFVFSVWAFLPRDSTDRVADQSPHGDGDGQTQSHPV